MNLYSSPGYTLSIYHKRSCIVILGSISSLDMLILQFFLIRLRAKLSLATKTQFCKRSQNEHINWVSLKTGFFVSWKKAFKHNVVSSTPHLSGIRIHNVSSIKGKRYLNDVISITKRAWRITALSCRKVVFLSWWKSHLGRRKKGRYRITFISYAQSLS